MLILTVNEGEPDVYLFDGPAGPGSCCGWVGLVAGGWCRVGLDCPAEVQVLRGEVIRKDLPALWEALGGRPPAGLRSQPRTFATAAWGVAPDAARWGTPHGPASVAVLKSFRPVLLDLRLGRSVALF